MVNAYFYITDPLLNSIDGNFFVTLYNGTTTYNHTVIGGFPTIPPIPNGTTASLIPNTYEVRFGTYGKLYPDFIIYLPNNIDGQTVSIADYIVSGSLNNPAYTASYAISSMFANTASYALNISPTDSASYALFAVTSSLAKSLPDVIDAAGASVTVTQPMTASVATFLNGAVEIRYGYPTASISNAIQIVGDGGIIINGGTEYQIAMEGASASPPGQVSIGNDNILLNPDGTAIFQGKINASALTASGLTAIPGYNGVGLGNPISITSAQGEPLGGTGGNIKIQANQGGAQGGSVLIDGGSSFGGYGAGNVLINSTLQGDSEPQGFVGVRQASPQYTVDINGTIGDSATGILEIRSGNSDGGDGITGTCLKLTDNASDNILNLTFGTNNGNVYPIFNCWGGGYTPGDSSPTIYQQYNFFDRETGAQASYFSIYGPDNDTTQLGFNGTNNVPATSFQMNCFGGGNILLHSNQSSYFAPSGVSNILGVGTSPNHTFDVAGDINFSGNLLKNGSTYVPANATNATNSTNAQTASLALSQSNGFKIPITLAGSASITSSTSKIIAFSLAMPSTAYVVQLEPEAAGITSSFVTGKTKNGFTASFGPSYTGLIDWVVVGATQ